MQSNHFYSRLQQDYFEWKWFYFVNLPKSYKTVIFSQLENLKLTKCRPPKNMDRSASPLTIFDIIPFHFPLCLSKEPHAPSNLRNWRNLKFSFSENIVTISWYSPWIKSVTWKIHNYNTHQGYSDCSQLQSCKLL